MVASRSPSYSAKSSDCDVDRAEQRDAVDPAGQRDRRQVEQHRPAEVAAEDEAEQHPDHHDHHAEPHVEPERLAPRLLRAPQRDDQRGHPDQHQQDQRVGGQRRGHGQPDRPQPPGDRVQVAGAGSRRRVAPAAYDGHGAARGEQQARRRPDRPRSAGRRRTGRRGRTRRRGGRRCSRLRARPSVEVDRVGRGIGLDRTARPRPTPVGARRSASEPRRGRRRGGRRAPSGRTRHRRAVGWATSPAACGRGWSRASSWASSSASWWACSTASSGAAATAACAVGATPGCARRAVVPRERDVPTLGHSLRARTRGGVGPLPGPAVGPAEAPVGVGRRGVDARLVGRAGAPSTRHTKPGWRCT